MYCVVVSKGYSSAEEAGAVGSYRGHKYGASVERLWRKGVSTDRHEIHGLVHCP